MLSAALRQVPLALFFCAVTLGINPAVLKAEESGYYKLGRVTAYASHCGYSSLAKEMRQRYGGVQDFKTGLRENDLSSHDYVWGLPCGKVERSLEEFLEKVKAAEAK